MLSITFPLWLIVSAIAAPLLAAGLCLRIVRTARSRCEHVSDLFPETAFQVRCDDGSGFDERIQEQILEQQIDTVFNGLLALIETERRKLKILMHHGLTLQEPSAAALPAAVPERIADDPPSPGQSAAHPAQSVADLARKGMSQNDIARHMDMSQNEIRLALKMSAAFQKNTESGIEAIA